MKKRRGITIKHESSNQTFIRYGTELSYIANLLVWHNDQQADFFNHHGKKLFRELLTIKRKCTVLTLLLTAFIVLNVIMFFILFQTRQHLPNSVHTDSAKESNAIQAPTMAMPIAHFDRAMDCSVREFCFSCKTLLCSCKTSPFSFRAVSLVSWFRKFTCNESFASFILFSYSSFSRSGLLNFSPSSRDIFSPGVSSNGSLRSVMHNDNEFGRIVQEQFLRHEKE